MDFSEFLKNIELSPHHKDILLHSKKIISFAPHPDDNEFVAGGFVAKKIQEGGSFLLVVVSDGSKGSTTIGEEELIRIRKREQEEALAFLGSKNVKFLGYKDSEVPSPPVLRNDIIKIIRDFGPDLVITVDPFLPFEIHPDHINTGLAVLQAVLFTKFPSIGEGRPVTRPNVALGFPFSPNVIIDCSETMDKKIAALKCHKSQFPDDSSIETVKTILSLYGARIGSRCAEPFKVLMPHELHINVLAGMNPR